jgi:tetratricopeptide (TPR) repeat protein
VTGVFQMVRGALLYRRYQRTGDLNALQAAVRVFRVAVLVSPRRQRADCLAALAGALDTLSERTGDRTYLQEAITLSRDAVNTVPRARNHVLYLSHLANRLHVWYELTGDQDALHESVDVGRAGIAAAAGRPLQPQLLSDLASKLQSVFDRTGDVALLREAATLASQAVAAAPDEPVSLTNLGCILHTLYEYTGDQDALRQSVAAHRDAVATGADDPSRPQILANLGNALQAVYQDTGKLSALREAVSTLQAAVAAMPGDYRDRAHHLSSLGTALGVLYDRTGERETLHEAIYYSRVAVEATPAENIDRARRLTSLGAVLSTWFQGTGDRDALHESVAAHRGAAAAAIGDRQRGACLSNYSAALLEMSSRLADPALLREAVDSAREAVACTPDDHFSRAMRLTTLSLALQALARQTEDLGVLREAASVGRSAVASDPGRPDVLTNLGGTLRYLFDRTKELDTLREAVRFCQEAAAVASDELPDQALLLSNLGITLYMLAIHTDDEEVLAQARATLARAAGHLTGAVRNRITAGRAQARADIHADDACSAVAAMEGVVSLMPLLAAGDLRRVDREYRLGEVAGIGAQAAACALSAGRPEQAVVLLEQSRGLLLAETMDARSQLNLLADNDPGLAEEFRALRDYRAALDAEQTAEPDPSGTRDAHYVADLVREAAREWDALLARIRARPRLAGFLTPPSIDELQRQAAQGPIVMVIADEFQCDALVLTGDPDHPVQHVPLDDLTEEAAQEQSDRLTAAFQAAATATDLPAIRQAQRDLHEILGWLWDTTAGPVLAALGHTTGPLGQEPWPRLWWCPAGAMARFPLHAAGHHEDLAAGAAAPRTVLDRVVSSYTATVQTLAYARQARVDADTGPALIVSMPVTPDGPALPAAAAEASQLTALLQAAGTTVLSGAQATCDSVLGALPVHHVAHFACHAVSDPAEPGASHLLLHDHATHPLTVSSIARLHLPAADLAYLSACSTTVTSLRLADEAVHLTAAFQVAGYRNVIGTLWPVGDRTATRIATEVFTFLTDSGKRPPATARTAVALHHATRRLRDEHLDLPFLWAGHIHAGT